MSVPKFRLGPRASPITGYQGQIGKNGTCWHQLFRNPVVVADVPIALRAHDEKGLEIPMNMMMELGQAYHAITYDDTVLIKGHSTMFVPTKVIQRSVFWHFIYNKDGRRIPYSAAASRTPHHIETVDLSLRDMEVARLFVGWTASAISKAGESCVPDFGAFGCEETTDDHLIQGAEEIKYESIEYSQSEHVGKGYAFEKATITAGMYATVGMSFVRGRKDMPLHLSSTQDIYEEQMFSARNSHVVLYDVGSRRSWLFDGASVLLHITRTQLESAPYNKNSKEILSRLKLSQPEDGADAAWLALQDAANRKLPIITTTKVQVDRTESVTGDTAPREERKTTTTHWCFEDLVQRTWHVLEQMIDHQSELSAEPAKQLHLTHREKLEGFEFMDVVRRKHVMRPRVATLMSSGRGWVELIRSIGAVCLFGRGFGDLVVPGPPSGSVCRLWTRVPEGKDYLTALVSVLRSICQEHGSIESTPLRLAQGVFWHQPHKVTESCGCQSQGHRQTCDLVQVLLPPNSLGPKNRPDALNQPHGAVIFGKSRRLYFEWPNIGPPKAQIGHDVNSQEERESQDSALGSSLANSAPKSSPGGSPCRVPDLPDVTEPGPESAPEDREVHTTLSYGADSVLEPAPAARNKRRELFPDLHAIRNARLFRGHPPLTEEEGHPSAKRQKVRRV